jgi:hypothetical protein
MLFNEAAVNVITQSRVVLEKLTVTHIVKKFPAIHRNKKFITVFIKACYWSLS